MGQSNDIIIIYLLIDQINLAQFAYAASFVYIEGVKKRNARSFK
jgi:hypothetical protein